MTVATKIMMGSGATEASAYEIEQSLILDSGSASVLSFTPSSSGSRTTWTFSSWLKVKSGATSFRFFGYQDPGGPHQQSLLSMTNGAQLQFHDDKGGTGTGLKLNRVLRDPSAWYHIVMVMDTTQSTAANRVRFYVNGELETSFAQANYPGQNASPYLNSGGVANKINFQKSGTSSCQLAETQFIDGTALTPSSFGETNEDTGQWIPKEYEGGSYGTNGFYLKFASGAIGTDSSGEGNNYTATNLVNSDVVIDTPTNNFATMNSIYVSGDTNTFSEGNLKIVMATGNGGLAVATIVPTAGKYYAEFKMTAGNPSYGFIGVDKVGVTATAPAYALNSSLYYGYTGDVYTYPGNNVIGSGAAYGTNDVVGVALDYDNSTIKWYKNNALQFTQTSVDLTDRTFAIVDTSGGAGQTMEINFGQKTLAYTPPSGYLALCTANLPDPAIPLPSAHFNTVAYAGNAGTNAITGVGFPPDFVWVKKRTQAGDHVLQDKVRGTYQTLISNKTNAENTNSALDWFKSFDSDGFTASRYTSGGVETSEWNYSGQNYVSWNWKANGSGSSNSDGTITSTVSANQTSGFSIVKYTGTGTNVSVGHGLNAVPELVIVKSLSTSNWWVYTTAIDGSLDYLALNINAAAGNASQTASTSTLFYQNNTNASIAYCFASKPGFSKIGTYTGNGNADGPFIFTGFKPAWVMVKRTDATAWWTILDNARTPFNEMNKQLYANEPNAESSLWKNDFLSNGFKFRNAGNDINNNNGVYLYMAFADSPFKTSNAH